MSGGLYQSCCSLGKAVNAVTSKLVRNARNRVKDAGWKCGDCGNGSKIISLSSGAPRIARHSFSSGINPTSSSKSAQSVPEELVRRSIRCRLRSQILDDLVNRKTVPPSSPSVHRHREFFPFLNYFSFFLRDRSAVPRWIHNSYRRVLPCFAAFGCFSSMGGQSSNLIGCRSCGAPRAAVSQRFVAPPTFPTPGCETAPPPLTLTAS